MTMNTVTRMLKKNKVVATVALAILIGVIFHMSRREKLEKNPTMPVRHEKQPVRREKQPVRVLPVEYHGCKLTRTDNGDGTHTLRAVCRESTRGSPTFKGIISNMRS